MKQSKGKIAVCKLCKQKTYWYVAILKGNHEATMVKHWFICMKCYEDEPWLIETKLKELTMKSGLSNGSTQSASKPNGSPSVDRSEENTQAISNWKSKKYKW